MGKVQIYYKALAEDGRHTPQGYGEYDPEPGKVETVGKGKLVVCEFGLHLLLLEYILEWECPQLWQVEPIGRTIVANDKIVARSFRWVAPIETWNARTQRLFACDCGERALTHLVTPDQRSIEAISTARLFANGKASRKELAAAGDAALAAAGDAALAAAWAAARDAALAAARAAARAAALAAARAAARAAERQWQVKRLAEYLNGEMA